jgi:hypothetical protein
MKREERRAFDRPGSESEDGIETDFKRTESEALEKFHVTKERNESPS